MFANMLKLKRQEEQGVALLEFAIALPAIVVFLGGIATVGVALIQYFEMLQVVREGVRVMSNLQNLEGGEFNLIGENDAVDDKDCFPNEDSLVETTCHNHLFIQRTLARLTAWYGYDVKDLNLEITTNYETGETLEDGKVKVNVSLDFPLGKNPAMRPRMNINAIGPYLAF